jgi:hypothetical protein
MISEVDQVCREGVRALRTGSYRFDDSP